MIDEQLHQLLAEVQLLGAKWDVGEHFPISCSLPSKGISLLFGPWGGMTGYSLPANLLEDSETKHLIALHGL